MEISTLKKNRSPFDLWKIVSISCIDKNWIIHEQKWSQKEPQLSLEIVKNTKIPLKSTKYWWKVDWIFSTLADSKKKWSQFDLRKNRFNLLMHLIWIKSSLANFRCQRKSSLRNFSSLFSGWNRIFGWIWMLPEYSSVSCKRQKAFALVSVDAYRKFAAIQQWFMWQNRSFLTLFTTKMPLCATSKNTDLTPKKVHVCLAWNSKVYFILNSNSNQFFLDFMGMSWL